MQAKNFARLVEKIEEWLGDFVATGDDAPYIAKGTAEIMARAAAAVVDGIVESVDLALQDSDEG
ncbi:hypothetical protein FBQ81_03345 [Chloroflexi bacterium CFX6]|nr:hypothetical protein [Chloroflexi bacterium CFX6]